MTRRVLVTGGSGFIGSALVKALLAKGWAVRVLDDNSRGSMRRLRGLENDIEFIQGDIRDPNAVLEAVDGVDEVHHLAFVNGIFDRLPAGQPRCLTSVWGMQQEEVNIAKPASTD